MTDSLLLAVADGIVEGINLASFSQPLTAVRHYQPKFDLKEMDQLHVSVVPRSITEKRLSRALTAYLDTGGGSTRDGAPSGSPAFTSGGGIIRTEPQWEALDADGADDVVGIGDSPPDQHGHRLHVRPALLVDLDRA